MAGVAGGILGVLLVGETLVYAFFPRADTVLEHFMIFEQNRLVGLLTLDLLGMIAYLVFIPLILALYVALRRTAEGLMAIAAVLFFLGIADFFATNNLFAILTLSDQYASASTSADRELLLAAGQAMFTLFNENAFLVSYVLVSASWAMISVVMLRSKLFARVTGWSGFLAGAAGIAAVILEHASPQQAVLNVAIGFYFAAIVLLFVWVLGVGRRLYRLAA
ncbi:MAG TPA: DUF4386 family protein [Acidimicrobiia bacterium]|nr:DUF4386 family protein [Acidimicrobiia bacterium]